MTNFLKDTVGKIAGNVTQSVASTVIVFLITTYVLVDLGKKDKGKDTDTTSVKTESIIAAPTTETNRSATSREPDVQPAKKQDMQTELDRKQVPPPTSAGNGTIHTTSIVPEEATKEQEVSHEVQKPPVKNQTEQKLDATVSEARAKADTLVKNKKPEVKGVQKRADDIFDELDEETAKTPPK